VLYAEGSGYMQLQDVNFVLMVAQQRLLKHFAFLPHCQSLLERGR
jgi:hypothetical protein